MSLCIDISRGQHQLFSQVEVVEVLVEGFLEVEWQEDVLGEKRRILGWQVRGGARYAGATAPLHLQLHSQTEGGPASAIWKWRSCSEVTSPRQQRTPEKQPGPIRAPDGTEKAARCENLQSKPGATSLKDGRWGKKLSPPPTTYGTMTG